MATMASGDGGSKADWDWDPDATQREGEEVCRDEPRQASQAPMPVSPHGPEPSPVRPFSTSIGKNGPVGVTAEGGGLEAWIKKANQVHEEVEFVMEPDPPKKRGPGRPRGRSLKKPPPKVRALMLDLRRKLGDALAKDPAPGSLLSLTKCVVLLAQLEGAKVNSLAADRRIKTGTPPSVEKKRCGRAKPNNDPSYDDDLLESMETN